MVEEELPLMVELNPDESDCDIEEGFEREDRKLVEPIEPGD